jgi:protein gp37
VTNIQWTDATWNPTTGCDRISPGCDHCYALTMAKRLKGMGQAKYQNDGDPRTSGPGFGLTVHPDVLTEPLRWKKPRTVFVNSMSDLFHARVPVEFIRAVWEVMQITPQHTYQILTKRAARLPRVLDRIHDGPGPHGASSERPGSARPSSPPSTPAAPTPCAQFRRRRPVHLRRTPHSGALPNLDLTSIDWLIIGGESGAGARPLSTAWVHDLLHACQQTGTAPFVKQLGSVWARDTEWGGKSVHAHGDTKGGDPDYWPSHLRVREYPTAREATDA